ncbi:acyl-CoA dehydrogenase family protein [Variovorax sp. PCZ-1]|uniref:acyl-CoA dehydrogenase family protein n=1 Tax=Variovorax sp. PCZ-1 TaxID=2835533 RepID=UPI001BD08FAF|nr:acyl-CoA dehydrogenase family protein [Variovorax sp. PCZ-1]MBS7806612.1 acyl-CoA dehydrogenase family protein [Variovorax sp. PCZ-1]
MDFEFTEDHESLRDAVRRYIDKVYSFEHRKSIVAKGGFDRAAYSSLAELGLAGLRINDQYGGMGMGSVESMIVMEELGRGVALEPLSQSLLCSLVIQAYAPEAIKQAWLPLIASGEKIVVLAAQERKARYTLDKCEAKAALAGTEYALNAIKNVVSAGDHADAFIVPALLDGKLALFLVERAASGVSTRGYGCQDGSRAADVTLVNAPAQLITSDGAAALQLATDCGIANTCAYAVGVMDKTIAVTADYMNTRKQFGQTLSTFQALRHRIADVKMQLELARSMSYFVNMKLSSPAPDRSRAASQAKLQLGQSMRFVGQQAVQLHGGIGVTDEYIVSHYFKTLTQLEMSFGDTMHHLAEVSARMQDTAGVFA